MQHAQANISANGPTENVLRKIVQLTGHKRSVSKQGSALGQVHLVIVRTVLFMCLNPVVQDFRFVHGTEAVLAFLVNGIPKLSVTQVHPVFGMMFVTLVRKK